MNVVPDASIVVKWYAPSVTTSRHATSATTTSTVTTSSSRPLLPSEVVNALRYSGHYEGDRLAAASDSLAAYGIDLRPFADAGAVTRVAEAVDVPVYDASYVALAAEVDGRAYTADDTLLAAIEDTAYGDRWPTSSGTGNPSVFPSGLKPE